MLFRLLLLFTIVPLVELVILLILADATTWWFTIGLVLVTGIIGASLARWQGFRTVRRIQDDLRRKRIPADALLDGLLILIAGALLVTPGILTDIAGFLLLTPPFRSVLKRRMRSRMTVFSRFRTTPDLSAGGPETTGAGGRDAIVDVWLKGPTGDASAGAPDDVTLEQAPPHGPPRDAPEEPSDDAPRDDRREASP
jgi:UPF0716 protein FxsA